MNKPGNYEWWVDAIQDCIIQISSDFSRLNPNGGACRHICEETYHDFDHFMECIASNEYCDINDELYLQIIELKEMDDYECDEAREIAINILNSDYFKNRERWKYGI